jgi:hypothetical protein
MKDIIGYEWKYRYIPNRFGLGDGTRMGTGTGTGVGAGAMVSQGKG